ncbi:MAG TPA: tyrosine-type recombinase/integrase [Vicinamibacteria bacterium]|nr:tyrosine-type recombinase/integrase [Vicinamibacteria bacterium]
MKGELVGRVGGTGGFPALIAGAGERASRRFVEFFTAHIRNPNTRRAYAWAASRFLGWCESNALRLESLEPVLVAAYIEGLPREVSAPTVKQHLAALRSLFDYLATGGVLSVNPAAAVRGPKHVVKVGKTPVLFPEEARQLLDSIEASTVLGLRDRALIAIMIYSFARVGAVVKMRVKDYYSQGRRAYFRLHEKGGKYHQVPAHHNAAAYVDAYLEAAEIKDGDRNPLFRSAYKRSGELTAQPLTTSGVLKMVKRRAATAGLPRDICCHTFRATGITAFLQNGGELTTAQRIAAHESPRTTALYDRTQDEVNLDEIERIRI